MNRLCTTLIWAAMLFCGVPLANAQFVYLLHEARVPLSCSIGPKSCTVYVDVINVATGHTVATILVEGSGQKGTGIALGPGALRAYVTSHPFFGGSGALNVIDAIGNQVIGEVSVGLNPADVVLTPDGNRAYVANSGSNTVSVVDLAALSVIATLPVGTLPSQLAISPDGSVVYVTNTDANTVSRIATATNQVTGTIAVGSRPSGLDVSPDGSRVFVANTGAASEGSPSLSVIDALTGVVTATFAMGTVEAPPTRVSAISATRAYVAFTADNAVHLFDVGSGGFVNHVVTSRPQALALDSERARLFIAGGEFGSDSGLKVVDVGTTSYAPFDVPASRLWTDLAITPGDATCLFEADPLTALHGAAGGAGTITIPAPTGCAWSVSVADSTGLTLEGPLSGVGPTALSYTLSPTVAPRVFTLRLPRHSVVLEQTVPAMAVDPVPGGPIQQSFTITGWAIEQDVTSFSLFGFSGVDAVHVWAYPSAGGPPIFTGAADLRCCNRPDVAAVYGIKYINSGFRAPITNLPTGSYTLAVFAHSSRHGAFTNVATAGVTVVAAPPRMVVDAPAAGAEVRLPFSVAGWAVDPRGAINGPGIDVVHVWAYPATGGAPMFVGQAAFGGLRPDVGSLLGTPFIPSGFNLLVTALGPGAYSLVVFARSVATGNFDLAQVVPIRIRDSDPQMFVDTPTARSSLASPFTVAGWALDLSASAGVGVDAVHVWAYPIDGPAPLFVGAASPASRPDVAAVFGSRYGLAGFTLSNATLPAGVYDLVVFARSTVSGSFNNTRTVRIVVN